MSVTSFITNVYKAAILGKFGLEEIFYHELRMNKTEVCESPRSHNLTAVLPEVSKTEEITTAKLSPLLELTESTTVLPAKLNKTLPLPLYNKHLRKQRPTITIFSPEMQKRLLSPRASVTAQSFGGTLGTLSKHSITPRGTSTKSKVFLKIPPPNKEPSTEEKELSKCTFEPLIMSHTGKYKDIKSKITSPKTTKAVPRVDIDATYFLLFVSLFRFLKMYEKVKNYQKQDIVRRYSTQSATAFGKYQTSNPKKSKARVVKACSSITAKSFTNSNGSGSQKGVGSFSATHRASVNI